MEDKENESQKYLSIQNFDKCGKNIFVFRDDRWLKIKTFNFKVLE